LPTFGRTSSEELASCHDFVRACAERAIAVVDFKVLCGHRVKDRQDHYFNTGRSKVQWPNSKHNSLPSMAFDFAPWPIDWGDTGTASERAKARARFYFVQGVLMAMAHQINRERVARGEATVFLPRGGHDWDGNGIFTDQRFDDLGHFEVRQVAASDVPSDSGKSGG